MKIRERIERVVIKRRYQVKSLMARVIGRIHPEFGEYVQLGALARYKADLAVPTIFPLTPWGVWRNWQVQSEILQEALVDHATARCLESMNEAVMVSLQGMTDYHITRMEYNLRKMMELQDLN